MSHFNKFKHNQILTTKQAAEIKGGVRFITTSHRAYKEKRRELMKSATPFLEDVNHANSSYCIEW